MTPLQSHYWVTQCVARAEDFTHSAGSSQELQQLMLVEALEWHWVLAELPSPCLCFDSVVVVMMMGIGVGVNGVLLVVGESRGGCSLWPLGAWAEGQAADVSYDLWTLHFGMVRHCFLGSSSRSFEGHCHPRGRAHTDRI